MYTACGRCRKPILKAAGAPPTLGIPPLAGALHQRGPSFGNRSRQGSIGQRRSHSRGHSTTFGGLGIDTKANQLVEGGFGYCSSCKEATARCSIWYVPSDLTYHRRQSNSHWFAVGYPSAVSTSTARLVRMEDTMNAIVSTTSDDQWSLFQPKTSRTPKELLAHLVGDWPP